MHLAERPRERDRDAQEIRHAQGPTRQSIDRRPAGILKHQRHAVVVARQHDWSRCPGTVKFVFERIFVFEPLDATERGYLRGNKQDRRQGVAGATVETDVSFPHRREYVARELLHEGLLPGGLLSYSPRAKSAGPRSPPPPPSHQASWSSDLPSHHHVDV